MANVVDINKQRMDALTAGLPSKSARMRRLAKSGYRKADIARYLGVRYQFVYNVLSAPDPDRDRGETGRQAKVAGAARSRTAPRTVPGAEAAESAPPRWAWATVEKGGRLDVPTAFLEDLGLGDGAQVQLALEGESIRVLTRAAALRALQAEARRFVPEGVSLVDELIAERRAEVEIEGPGTDGVVPARVEPARVEPDGADG